MPFLVQEGHVLRARKACSEMLSRPFSNREGRGEKSWRDFSLTEHTATSPPAPLRMELLFLHIFFKTCIEGYLVFKYS